VVRQARAGLALAVAGRASRPDFPLLPGSRDGRRTVPTWLAATTSVLAVVNVASMHGRAAGQIFGILAATAAVVPLMLVVRAPLLAWRTGVLALALIPALPTDWWGGWPWGPAQILSMLAVFCLVGVTQPRAGLWTMWALTLPPWWLWLAARLPNLDGPIAATLVFTSITVALDSMSSGLLARRRLAAETGRADAEQARRAVLEERTRIARELHDVVAHHMSLIAVRAESAGFRLADVPEPALAEFGSLSQLARAAMADMRRLLGVLRQDLPADLEPQPQLTDLPALVDAARQAGVAVSLTSSGTGTAAGLPESVSLCAYRIIQESLSNASQHAAGAAVSICVDQDEAAVRLQIINGPAAPASASAGPASARPASARPASAGPVPARPASAGPASAGPASAGPASAGPVGGAGEPRVGHGLTGMRERVALLGGSLTAGRVPQGGFAVTAILPLAEAA
jgi:signal transduction histidine kinase